MNYLMVITTILVLTQVIRVAQNAIHLMNIGAGDVWNAGWKKGYNTCQV